MLDWFVPLLEIALINLILSGDNAVVIAMACRNLKPEHRQKAIWIGTGAAVALRIMLTAVAAFMLTIPYLQALGSILLLYIAIRMLTDNGEHGKIRSSSALMPAIWTIIVADFIMSVDNVLAVAAISDGNVLMLIIGIGMSIPLIIWGSGMIVRLLDRYPIVLYIGAAILAYTAGEMLITDPKMHSWLQYAHGSYVWLIPATFIIVTLAAGMYYHRSSD